jgi:uncharacterized protein YndB with AHSA1/START domain
MAMTSSGRTTFTTPSDLEVASSRVFAAPRQLVWDAWTKPEHLPHWLLGPAGWEMTTCDIDLRPGGQYRYVWHHTDGRTMEISGEYLEIDPPERLVSTERWGGDFPEAVNTLILVEDDGKTQLTCTTRCPTKAARDAAIATGMNDGVERSYGLLDEYLARATR